LDEGKVVSRKPVVARRYTTTLFDPVAIAFRRDIADAILFLASDRSSHVNGDEITVDGGYVRTLMNLVPRPGF